MANGHGGSRPGAGRKAKEDKFEAQVAAAEQTLADRLPQTIDNLIHLADGGYEIISEHYEPAGMIYVDATHVEEGKNGPVSLRVKVKAFPDLDPQDMILVKRVKSIAAPDRVANIYLADRIMGKPKERHEHTGEDGEAISFAVVRVPAKQSPEEWQQNAQAHQQQKNTES